MEGANADPGSADAPVAEREMGGEIRGPVSGEVREGTVWVPSLGKSVPESLQCSADGTKGNSETESTFRKATEKDTEHV